MKYISLVSIVSKFLNKKIAQCRNAIVRSSRYVPTGLIDGREEEKRKQKIFANRRKLIGGTVTNLAYDSFLIYFSRKWQVRSNASSFRVRDTKSRRERRMESVGRVADVSHLFNDLTRLPTRCSV